MTDASTSGLTTPTRTEAQAREARQRKQLADALRADGVTDETTIKRVVDETQNALRIGQAQSDMLAAIFGGAR